MLPTLWFRNRWSWGRDNPRPVLEHVAGKSGVVRAVESDLGERYLYCDGQASLLFTENETNTQRLVGVQNRTPFVKDGINNYVVHGQRDVVNPQQTGTKVAAHYRLTVPPGKSEVVRLRLTPVAPDALSKSYGKGNGAFGKHFDEIMETRRQEADEFYASVIPPSLDADAANVMRQALAGMLWSKQFYLFRREPLARGAGQRSVPAVAQGRAAQRALASHVQRRRHLHAGQVGVSLVRGVGSRLPRAAADAGGSGFRQAATGVDAARELPAPERADARLRVELRRRQPAGSRVGDDLHLSTWRKRAPDKGDIVWLERCFQKLLLNFTWWLNRKDRAGKNAFEGGFLGLDNIGVFDRSSPLPTGGYLEQADGTAWMALFSLNMLEISVELAHAQRGLRGHGPQVPPALSFDCLGDDPRGRQHRHVG